MVTIPVTDAAGVKTAIESFASEPNGAAAGALMSYDADGSQIARGAASYVDLILRGAKVGELPVQYPTTFRLVVNLKAAKAIGLTIPASFLLLADEVIE